MRFEGRSGRVEISIIVLVAGLFLSLPGVSGSQSDDPDSDDALAEELGLSQDILAELRRTFTEEGDVIRVLGDGGEALDLSDCVTSAFAANAFLQQEREGLAELQGRKIQARSTGMPRFDLRLNWTRGRDPTFALDATFAGGGADSIGGFPIAGFLPGPEEVPAQTYYRASVETFWELRLTRVIRAVRVAKWAIRRQESIVLDVENRTVEDVLAAYHGVILAHERLQAAAAEIDARYEFLETTRRRLLLDMATPLDTLRAAVSWANLEPQRRRYEQELRRAAQELNVLMGRDPRHPVQVRATFPLETDEVPRDVALRLASRRPDVDQQQLQSEMLRIQRGVQKAQNHPYLTVEGSLGVLGRSVGSLDDSGHDFWRASVSLTLPLWDGQLVKGEVRETEASIRRNEHLVDEQVRRAQHEVLTALDELSVARADLSAARLNMAMAEQAFEQVSLRYELGRSDYLEVLDAQAERFVARSTLLSARFQVLSSTATLKRAMGMSPMQPLSFALGMARPMETSP
jgi:outer membrane protein TolC